MKKNIFIDCQILQTDAFDRGMGKYSLSLLSALKHNQSFLQQYNVTLVLNKSLGLKKPNERALNVAMPEANKLTIDLPINIAENLSDKYIQAGDILTTAIKKRASKGDVYLILAPFFVGFPAIFPKLSNVKKVSIVYDLIPYLVWHKMCIFPDEVYFKHYQLLIEANTLLTISQAVKNDLENIVGIPSEKILSIDGGPFLVDIQGSAPRPSKRPYVLCVSAPILHKNNDRAVKAFDQFNKHNNNVYDLVFTSNFDDITRQRLNSFSDNLIFTGNVSDEALYWLYEGAESILLASLTEGLGLPVLEGVAHNKPIACSRIPVLMEISPKAFFTFDPTSIAQITSAIADSVKKEGYEKKRHSYTKILNKYTWKRSAGLALLGLQLETRESLTGSKKDLRIYVSDPRNGSAEGKLLEKLYPRLSDRYNVQVSLVGKHGTKEPSYLPYVLELDNNDTADLVLVIGGTKAQDHKVPTVRIVVNQRRQRLAYAFVGYKRKYIDLRYNVSTDILYPELGFKVYYLTAQNGTPITEEGICKQIMEVFERKK